MGSFQMDGIFPGSASPESSCSYLLQELKMIWDEVGQEKDEREWILRELEQECMEVYRRKVDDANMHRARLHQALAESEAEYTNLLLSLGERSFPGRPERMTGTLKALLDSITPALQEMQLRKEARVRQFWEVQIEIQRIASEIGGNPECEEVVVVNESDLSLKKLAEYQNEVERLKKDKSYRLHKVKEYKTAANELAVAMGMDPYRIIADVHPSLLDDSNGQQSKNISDDILNKLNRTVYQLQEEKQLRMEKLRSLEKALTNLWNILDTPFEERRPFAPIELLSSAFADGTLSPGSLTLEIIDQIESEVRRLDQLKASKMKELFWKKQTEVEIICKKSCMEVPSQMEMENVLQRILSGEMDHDELLNTMEEYIRKAKEAACSRKDIMDKVEKWIALCDEEHWLEEYSRDEKRYSVARGAHKNLKRAERARLVVSKIPALVDLLVAKTKIWEEERKKVFFYDKLPLMAMLEDYILLGKEKEEEKRRQRERKKVQNLLVKRQESLYASRPNTSNSRPTSRGFGTSSGSASLVNKRLSGGFRKSNSDNNSSTTYNGKFEKTRLQKLLGNDKIRYASREDTLSEISGAHSGLSSP